MEKVDLRKMTTDELYAVRKQVVRLKKQGKKGAAISELAGISQPRISQVWSAYEAGGLAGYPYPFTV